MLPWPLFAFVPLGVILSACQRVSGFIPTEHAMGTELTGFNPKCRTTEMVLVNMHR